MQDEKLWATNRVFYAVNIVLQPPTVLHPSENHSEQESIEIAVTKLLLRSYYDIVRKNIEDSVPKAIMHFLASRTESLTIYFQGLPFL